MKVKTLQVSLQNLLLNYSLNKLKRDFGKHKNNQKPEVCKIKMENNFSEIASSIRIKAKYIPY